MPPCLSYWKAADYLRAIWAIHLLAFPEPPTFILSNYVDGNVPLLPTQHWPDDQLPKVALVSVARVHHVFP